MNVQNVYRIRENQLKKQQPDQVMGADMERNRK